MAENPWSDVKTKDAASPVIPTGIEGHNSQGTGATKNAEELKLDESDLSGLHITSPELRPLEEPLLVGEDVRRRVSKQSDANNVGILVEPWQARGKLCRGTPQQFNIPDVSIPRSLLSKSEQVYERGAQQSDILRSIPKPEYPIRMCDEGPHSMSPHTRRHWVKTTVWLFDSDHSEWRTEPDIKLIAGVVAPILEQLGVDTTTTVISKLFCGGFNQVYTVTASARNSSALQEYIFRVSLPVLPYYKTECEVATMEIVRNFTSIRLPLVYAYDSSTNNQLGLEWILMEKIQGQSLIEKWDDLSDETLVALTNKMADWQTELCSIRSNKIGGIYMRCVAGRLEFFVGPSVDLCFCCNRALFYDIPRGPFESNNDFYGARLQFAEQQLLDPLYLLLLKRKYETEEPLHPDQQELRAPLLSRKEEILSSELHEDDRDNFEKSGPQQRWFTESLPAVRALKKALWTISPADPLHPLVTMLGHNDLAARNIMVDADGNITGLLDWEHLDLQSLLFRKMKPYPEFLGSDEQEEEQVDDDIKMESYPETEEELAERLEIERYEATTAQLRTAYKKRLEELKSPLLEVLEQEETLDTILRDRAVYIIEDPQEMIAWVENRVKASAGRSPSLGDNNGEHVSEQDMST